MLVLWYSLLIDQVLRNMWTFGSLRIAVTCLKTILAGVWYVCRSAQEFEWVEWAEWPRMATPKAVQNGEGKGSKGSTCNWGNNDHILRDASKVREINVGDLFFIKGNGFPTGEKGLVHKSPPVQYHPDGFVKNRLVLKVDVPLQWNQWEPVALKEDKEGWILSSFSAAVCVDVYSQAVSKLF